MLLGEGSTTGKATRKIGVTEQTYYRWRREYGGMRIEQVKRLKELEKGRAEGATKTAKTSEALVKWWLMYQAQTSI